MIIYCEDCEQEVKSPHTHCPVWCNNPNCELCKALYCE